VVADTVAGDEHILLKVVAGVVMLAVAEGLVLLAATAGAVLLLAQWDRTNILHREHTLGRLRQV